jgi:glycosyl transferase family 4
MSWRVLITNVTMAGRTGTETVVRDLALGLESEGHFPMVYSPNLGEIAWEIASKGIPVVADLRCLPYEPDIIHGHHHVETVRALLHFPKAYGIFVCHDRAAHTDIPPRWNRLRRYVAVDYNCRQRLTDDYQIPEELIHVIYNWVDDSRFTPRPPLPEAPRRALVFSNYAGVDTHLEVLRAACADLKLPLDVLGSRNGNECAAPEQLLGKYDLVFAKARCALEAMAVGSAVILCDTRGLGPMVTPTEIEKLRAWNFGMRLLKEPLVPARVIQEIRRYDPADAFAVSQYIRKHANLSGALKQYLDTYQKVIEGAPSAVGPTSDEISDYLLSMVKRINELEIGLTQFRQPYRMEPLADESCCKLLLTLVNTPDSVRAGAEFAVKIELENLSSERLGSYPPFPLYFSYRWLSEAGNEMIIREGHRTPLRPPLSPGEKAAYFVRAIAPGATGSYRLRLTLVQELVRWLDMLSPPISLETRLEVA